MKRFYFNTCLPFQSSSKLYFLNQFINAMDLVPLEIIYHTGMTTSLPGSDSRLYVIQWNFHTTDTTVTLPNYSSSNGILYLEVASKSMQSHKSYIPISAAQLHH